MNLNQSCSPQLNRMKDKNHRLAQLKKVYVTKYFLNKHTISGRKSPLTLLLKLNIKKEKSSHHPIHGL